MSKVLKVQLKDNYDDMRNTRFYDKGECVKVDDNEYGDYYHLWIGTKLDLIPKNKCVVLGVLKNK